MKDLHLCNLGFGAAGIWFGLLGFLGALFGFFWVGGKKGRLRVLGGLGFFCIYSPAFLIFIPLYYPFKDFVRSLFTGAQKAQNEDVIYGNP